MFHKMNRKNNTKNRKNNTKNRKNNTKNRKNNTKNRKNNIKKNNNTRKYRFLGGAGANQEQNDDKTSTRGMIFDWEKLPEHYRVEILSRLEEPSDLNRAAEGNMAPNKNYKILQKEALRRAIIEYMRESRIYLVDDGSTPDELGDVTNIPTIPHVYHSSEFPVTLPVNNGTDEGRYNGMYRSDYIGIESSLRSNFRGPAHFGYILMNPNNDWGIDDEVKITKRSEIAPDGTFTSDNIPYIPDPDGWLGPDFDSRNLRDQQQKLYRLRDMIIVYDRM